MKFLSRSAVAPSGHFSGHLSFGTCPDGCPERFLLNRVNTDGERMDGVRDTCPDGCPNGSGRDRGVLRSSTPVPKPLCPVVAMTDFWRLSARGVSAPISQERSGQKLPCCVGGAMNGEPQPSPVSADLARDGTVA